MAVKAIISETTRVRAYFCDTVYHPVSTVYRLDSKTLTLTEPAFWNVSHEPGGGQIGLPRYLSPEASERLVLNMNFDAYVLRMFLRFSTFL